MRGSGKLEVQSWHANLRKFNAFCSTFVDEKCSDRCKYWVNKPKSEVDPWVPFRKWMTKECALFVSRIWL